MYIIQLTLSLPKTVKALKLLMKKADSLDSLALKPSRTSTIPPYLHRTKAKPRNYVIKTARLGKQYKYNV